MVCLGLCGAGAAGAAALSAVFATPASAATEPSGIGAQLPSIAANVLPLSTGRHSASVGASLYETTVRAAAAIAGASQGALVGRVPRDAATTAAASPAPSEPSTSPPVGSQSQVPWPTGWQGPRADGRPRRSVVGAQPKRPDRAVPSRNAPYRHFAPVASNAAWGEGPSPAHGSGGGEVLPVDPQAQLVVAGGRSVLVGNQAVRLLNSSRLARPG